MYSFFQFHFGFGKAGLLSPVSNLDEGDRRLSKFAEQLMANDPQQRPSLLESRKWFVAFPDIHKDDVDKIHAVVSKTCPDVGGLVLTSEHPCGLVFVPARPGFGPLPAACRSPARMGDEYYECPVRLFVRSGDTGRQRRDVAPAEPSRSP